MKQRINIVHFLSQWGRVSRYAVALCWLSGLLLGFIAANSANSVLISAISTSVGSPVPFARLVLICILPFVVSYLAFSLNEHWLLLATCLFEAFCFGYCAAGIGLAYGAAGWLIRFLLLFSDCMTIPVLLYYWMTAQSSGRQFRITSVIVTVYAIAVAGIDYFYIIPLLRAAVS